MKRFAMDRKLATVAVISFLLTPFAFAAPAVGSGAPTTPINVVSAVWSNGTAQPGDRGAIFNLTIQDLGLFTISGINEYMDLSSSSASLTNSTGGDLSSAAVSGAVGPGQTGTAQFVLDVAPAAPQGTLFVPVTIFYLNVTGTLQSEVVHVPVTISMPTQLTVIGSTWTSIPSGTPGGIQGDVADLLTVRVLNSNLFAIHNVTGVLTFSGAVFANLTGGLTADSKASIPGAFNPGRYGVLTFLLNVQPGAPVGEAPVQLNISFTDQWGLVMHQLLNFSVPVYGRTAPVVVPLTSSIPVGEVSAVSYRIEDAGSEPMYGPTFSLNVSAPLVIAANKTFSSGSVLEPGSSLVFTALVGAGPGVTPNIFQATLGVSYTDIFGVGRKQVFSFQLTVTGTISLVVLGSSVTQGTQNITVTGLLLNKGTSSAFFATLTGTLGASGTTYGEGEVYLGLISPSVPVPFTLTFPYRSPQANTNASVSLDVGFQNNFRENFTTTSLVPVDLLAPSSLAMPTGQPGGLVEAALASAVVVEVVVILGVSWLYFRARKK